MMAQSMCPNVCHTFQGKWNGQWNTKILGRESVCGCVFSMDKFLEYLNLIPKRDDGKKIINAYQFNELCKVIQNEDPSKFSEEDGLQLYQWLKQNFLLIVQNEKVVSNFNALRESLSQKDDAPILFYIEAVLIPELAKDVLMLVPEMKNDLNLSDPDFAEKVRNTEEMLIRLAQIIRHAPILTNELKDYAVKIVLGYLQLPDEIQLADPNVLSSLDAIIITYKSDFKHHANLLGYYAHLASLI